MLSGIVNIRVDQNRGQIVLGRSQAASLEIDQTDPSGPDHNIPGLKIPVKKQPLFSPDPRPGPNFSIPFPLRRGPTFHPRYPFQKSLNKVTGFPFPGKSAVEYRGVITVAGIKILGPFDLNFQKQFQDGLIDPFDQPRFLDFFYDRFQRKIPEILHQEQDRGRDHRPGSGAWAGPWFSGVRRYKQRSRFQKEFPGGRWDEKHK